MCGIGKKGERMRIERESEELNDLEVMKRWEKLWRRNLTDLTLLYFLFIVVIGIMASVIYWVGK